MLPPSATFSDFLHALGSPEALRQAAKADVPPTPRPAVNAHVHLPPNFSAFDTASQALQLAQAQGVRALGASNYYDYSVYASFAHEAIARGIFPLFGLEIIAFADTLARENIRVNDPGNPGKFYLCGKGITRFDPMSEEAQGLLQTIRDSDSQRMEAMTARLSALFLGAGADTGLDAQTLREQVARRHGCAVGTVYLQERHLAQAFQESLFDRVSVDRRTDILERVYGASPKASFTDAVGTQNDIRSFLMKAGKPAFAPDTCVDFGHARRLILALGGLLCYPMLADGTLPFTEYESDLDTLIADLQARGVLGVEMIPPRNSPEALARIVPALRAAGLFVTAGTEHNTLELLPLAPACIDGATIPPAVQDIFWEGACVVAAHQTLNMIGQPGFADTQGTPNPAYPTADTRIRAFAALGAAIFARCQEITS